MMFFAVCMTLNLGSNAQSLKNKNFYLLIHVSEKVKSASISFLESAFSLKFVSI